MAGSQLKRLKASLKDQGIIGPQQSKKQRRQAAQDDKARNVKRVQRGAALESIREQFNPFDLKHAKAPKFEVTSNRPEKLGAIKGRPGQAKAAAEERRRGTLLVDMQRRNKVGGILDRRFGENDPSIAPEDKMLERFAREKQRLHKKSSMFDLEEEDDNFDPLEGLTHGGKALDFDDAKDDFDEADLEIDDDSDGSVRQRQMLKRVRAQEAVDGDEEEEEEEEPQRKKTKKEVMEELIAKSKAHKYERQDAKDKDDDLRAELDKELVDIRSLLSSGRPKKPDAAEPQAATIAGVDRDAFERSFDLQVKKLAQDKRAQPSNRTKTDEEKADDESKRLKELEDKRQRRMRGEEVTDSEADSEDENAAQSQDAEGDDDDDDDFGLGPGIESKTRPTATELGFDDEDDFLIEDDLVASGSDVESLEYEDISDVQSSEEHAGAEDEEEDEFTRGLLNQEESRNPVFSLDTTVKEHAETSSDDHGLPFTFPCPATLAEFQSVYSKHPQTALPTIVQRIRALYHPKLDSKNKERLATFSEVLVDFLASSWDAKSLSFMVVESITRHVHSLAKMFPVEISRQFRSHLETIGTERPLALKPADLILLTAIGTVFPTSDHFHQVVTPAMLTIGRYLGQKVPQASSDYALGAFLSTLALQYQSLSKRYIPEVLNFILNTINSLSPAPLAKGGNFPRHEASPGIRLSDAKSSSSRRLTMADCVLVELDEAESKVLRVSVLSTCLQIIDAAADTWAGTPAFPEAFGQVIEATQTVSSSKSRANLPVEVVEQAEKLKAKLERMIRLSAISRRPLELHHHRPLAIKTYIPKFEETFDPDKHYDPDRERAELAKLKKEHKKERKGAMRELRKDANFMARENLKIKKAKDEAYEKKFKRLVAEIQSEEGRESNAYEREKSARKRAKNR